VTSFTVGPSNETESEFKKSIKDIFSEISSAISDNEDLLNYIVLAIIAFCLFLVVLATYIYIKMVKKEKFVKIVLAFQ
jgi:ABC-type phosphate transport system permease subunit